MSIWIIVVLICFYFFSNFTAVHERGNKAYLSHFSITMCLIAMKILGVLCLPAPVVSIAWGCSHCRLQSVPSSTSASQPALTGSWGPLFWQALLARDLRPYHHHIESCLCGRHCVPRTNGRHGAPHNGRVVSSPTSRHHTHQHRPTVQQLTRDGGRELTQWSKAGLLYLATQIVYGC